MNKLDLTFLLFFVFYFKHTLADYFLQSRFMLNKFKFGWEFLLPLASHCGIHALFTSFISLIFFTLTGKIQNIYIHSIDKEFYNLAFYLALLDFTIHFIMDRLKAGSKYMGRWKYLTSSELMSYEVILKSRSTSPAYNKLEAEKAIHDNTWFWRALGIDQQVHHMTDALIIWILIHAV